jgi:hypothetical protein
VLGADSRRQILAPALSLPIMTTLPPGSLLVRTYFGNDDSWQRLSNAVSTPNEDDFLAVVEFVEDRVYEGMDADGLVAQTPDDPNGPSVSFIADETTLATDGWPLLVVNVAPRIPGIDDDKDYTPFRVIASELPAVENNLNLSNLDWEDFADAVDDYGVFRGFDG